MSAQDVPPVIVNMEHLKKAYHLRHTLSFNLPQTQTLHLTAIGLPIRPGVVPGGSMAVPWSVWVLSHGPGMDGLMKHDLKF